MKDHSTSGNRRRADDGTIASSPHSEAESRSDAALALAVRGWPVFPLHAPTFGAVPCTCGVGACTSVGKHPRTKNGLKAATTDAATIERWFKRWPDANIATVTGAAAGDWVLDVDPGKGGDVSLADLERANGPLPETIEVETGGGGRHLRFALPRDGTVLRNRTNVRPGLDVRADGGYVVAPPSMHASGVPYRFRVGRGPDEIKLAEAPQWLVEIVLAHGLDAQGGQPAAEGATSTSAHAGRDDDNAAARPCTDGHNLEPRLQRYADAALRRSVSRLARAVAGERNDSLNRIAFNLGRFVGAGLLDHDQVASSLHRTAKNIGLTDRESEATIGSGLSAGAAKPLDVSALRNKLAKKRAAKGPDADQSSSSAKERPQIFLEAGRTHEAMEQAESYLLHDSGPCLFQRTGTLVRTMRLEVPTREGVQRPAGALLIRTVDLPYLADRFSRSAEFYKFDKRSMEWVRCDCPDRIARNFIARSGHWRVRVLTGVVEAPTLRSDGTILEVPGHDAGTGLLFDPGTTRFEPLLQHPTIDNARAALTFLLIPLEEFPWRAPCDRAAALAAILAALIRRSLRACPMFAARAPQRRSGKSLFASLVAFVATGRSAPCMGVGKDEDELSKRVLAVLLEGDLVICIDNVERPLGGQALCTALTEELFKGRILGESRNGQPPTQTLWIATGNNLVIDGDLVARVIPVDLDARCERPEERRFTRNVREYVLDNRPQLVRAGLTILRAFHVAGRPSQSLPPYGGFEEFSDWIRSALVWVGEDDCCEGRKRLERADPILMRLREVMTNWPEQVDSAPLTASEAIERAAAGRAAGSPALWNLLLDLATGSDGRPSPGRLGKWLGGQVDRILDGRRFRQAGERNGTGLWQLCTAPQGR